MEKTENNTKKETVQKKLKTKKKESAAEFKRKYFEYYDDIKTSHKQDW